MELLYLWIDDFRQIKQTGLQFTSKFNFKLDTNDSVYKLSIRLNESYAHIYPDQVANITGLVGRNGSGKSTIMHCLKLIHGQLARLTTSIIIVHLDPLSKKIHTNYYLKGGMEGMKELTLEVENEPLKGGFETLKANPYIVDRFTGEKGKLRNFSISLDDVACAYLTNSFDNHREAIYEGIINESTSQRVKEYLDLYVAVKERNAKRSQNAENKIELWPTHLEDYYRRELRRNITFLSFANKNLAHLLQFLPKTITIAFNFDDYHYLLENDGGQSLLLEQSHLIDIQKNAIEEISTINDKSKKFQNLLYLSTFNHALRHELFKVKKDDKFNQLLEFIMELKNVRKSESIMPTLKKIVDNYIFEPDESPNKTLKELLGSRLQSAFKNATSASENVEPGTWFSFKIDEKLWNLLGVVYDIRNKNDLTFLDYDWYPPLSSGEDAFITLFARLYEIKKRISTKPLLLLMDEVELYFHPEWQRSYIQYITNAIQAIFPNNKVQIILSTHSPLVVSDIPNHNLIFLSKNREGNCGTENIQLETFASNIHDLFTNAFFLDNGLMGRFSQEYINALIKEIDSKDSISYEYFQVALKNRIGIIGEQFIKSKILELVARKGDFHLVDEIFSEREKELDILRRIRTQKMENDKNPNNKD